MSMWTLNSWIVNIYEGWYLPVNSQILVWTRIYEEKFLVKIIEKYILLGQKLGQASILHQNLPCFFVSNFFNI